MGAQSLDADPTMTPAADTSKMRLVAIPRLAAGGRWRVEAMRTYSEPCFLWFTKGQGRITIAGITRGYTAHNGIYIPAGVMHGFEVGPQVFGTAVLAATADCRCRLTRCTCASARCMPNRS